jgi:hypothetical protein
MKKKILLALSVAGLAMASAKSYSVNLFQPAVLGSMQLAPGEYKVEVVDQKAVIRNGKVHGEAPVKVETNDSKYTTTTVRFNTGDGKMHISEIHLGGTKTKLIFSE